MKRETFFKLLAVAVACVCAAFAAYRHEIRANGAFGDNGAPLLSVAENVADTVAALVVAQNGDTLSFTKDKNNRWYLLEADNYPADKEKTDAYVKALLSLKKERRATALPEFYADEGLNEEDACFVSLLDADGNALASLFTGFEVAKGLYFVRKPDEAQTYLTASPVVLCQTDKENWINKTVYSFGDGSVQSVEYLLPRHPQRFVRFFRSSPRDGYATETSDDFFKFVLPDDAARNLASFSFETFRPAEENRETVERIVVSFFDGLKITWKVDADNTVSFEFDADETATQQTNMIARTLSDMHTPWRYVIPLSVTKNLNPFLELE